VVAGTGDALRTFGARGFEGLVLWAGTITNDVARVTRGLVPPQHPIRDERGVGYFVEGESLFELNVHLHRSGLLLLGQVHSHPGEAYHSEADDRYAIVTADGGYSLVAPDFGDAFAIASCAVYRLTRGEWLPLSEDEVRAKIRVE
jgi:proteasome lid subunit RPN8/RPN11